MDETKLRERLSDLAGDVRPVGSVPDGLVPRARRRAVLTSTASVLGVIAIVAVSFAGVRTIMRAEPVVPGDPHPSHHVVAPKPSHTPSSVTTAPTTEHSTEPSTAPAVAPAAPGSDRVTVVLSDGTIAAIDPDNDPPGYESLGLTDHAMPLAWAPDGRLAFTVEPGGGLFQMDASGNITQLADGTIYGASYSPDGTELVYSIVDGGPSQLHIVSGSAANGPSDEVLVDGSDGTWNLQPTWAHDGQTIAFVRGPSDGTECGHACTPDDDRDLAVWAIEQDGSNLRLISDAVHPRATFPMTWSPDGTELAATLWSGAGTPEVDVVSIRTGERYRLVANGQGPAWSPTGQAVAFVTPGGDGNWTVHLVDTDGQNERPLLTPPVDPSSSVLWSTFPAE